MAKVWEWLLSEGAPILTFSVAGALPDFLVALSVAHGQGRLEPQPQETSLHKGTASSQSLTVNHAARICSAKA